MSVPCLCLRNYLLIFSIRKRKDYRTRHDRTERQNVSWNLIYPELVNTYLAFDQKGPPDAAEENAAQLGQVTIIGTHGESYLCHI